MTKSWFRVTETAPDRVRGRRMASGDLLRIDPAEVAAEVASGHLVATTPEAECRPVVGLTEVERAALPRLAPLGEGPIEYAVGCSDVRVGEGVGMPMNAVPMQPDGEGGIAGALTEPAPELEA